MERDPEAQREFRNRLIALSDQLDLYRTPDRSWDPHWDGGTQETADAFFRASATISEQLGAPLNDSDPEAADILVALFGLDLKIVDFATALMVWTRQVPGDLLDAEHRYIDEALLVRVDEQLTVIAPEPDTGATTGRGRTGSGPGADIASTSGPYVDRILDSAAAGIADSIVAAGGVAFSVVGAVGTIGPHIWAGLPPGMRFLAHRALGSAVANVQQLLSRANAGEIDGTLNEVLGLVGGDVVGRTIKPPLARFLAAGVAIADADRCLATVSDPNRRREDMEKVVHTHHKRMRWITGGNIGARIFGAFGAAPLGLGLSAALVIVSVFLAHEHLDSRRQVRMFRKYFNGIVAACC